MKPNLINFSKALNGVFSTAKSKNPKLSLRKFSTEINVSAAELSQLMKANRPASGLKIQAIISRLPISPSEKADMVLKIFNPAKKDFFKINENQKTYKLIADPTCFAILQLLQTPSFESTIEFISERLNIPTVKANQLVLYMKGLGIIESVNGKLVRSINPIRTSDDVASNALKEHHQQDLNTIRECLKMPVEERDFSSLTIRLHPSDLDRAKEILRKAQDDIEALGQDRNPDEIYKVATYLFPISKKRS